MSSVEELMGVLDPIRLRRAIDAVEDISRNIERVAAALGATTDRARSAAGAADDLGDAAEDTAKKAKKAVDDIDQRYQQFKDNNISRVNLFRESWEKAFDRMDKKYRQFQSEAARHMTEARGPLGTAGNMLGLSGSRGAFGAMLTQIRAVASALPMGGLIGLAIYGKMEKQEWAAMSYRVARQFSQVGDIAGSAHGKFTGMTKSLGVSLNMAEGDLAAVAGGFAQFGGSVDQATRKATYSAKGFGKTVAGTALAFDVMAGAAAGTTAQAIGQAAQLSGEFDKSSDSMMRFALAIRDTGANYAQTIAGMVQAQASLRLQRQGVDDLAQGYTALRRALSSRFGTGPDQAAMVSSMTLSGIQGAARSVAGLSEGLAAVIGGRIGARTGVGPREAGIEAIVAFQEGMIGKQSAMFGEVVRELGGFAGEITQNGTRAEQIFALMKAGGMDFESARAIYEINNQMAQDIAAGVPEEKAMAKAQRELSAAFSKRYNEESAYRKIMRTIMMEIAKIGMAVAEMLIIGIGSIVGLLNELYLAFHQKFRPGTPVPEWARGLSKWFNQIPQYDWEAAATDITSALGRISGVLAKHGAAQTSYRKAAVTAATPDQGPKPPASIGRREKIRAHAAELVDTETPANTPYYYVMKPVGKLTVSQGAPRSTPEPGLLGIHAEVGNIPGVNNVFTGEPLTTVYFRFGEPALPPASTPGR